MLGLNFFLFLIYFVQFIENTEKKMFYRCGFDDYNRTPIHINNTFPKEQDKRRLPNGVNYGKFNIYIDYENIKNTINNYNLNCDVSFFIDSMNKAAETLKSLLKVRKNYVKARTTDDKIKRYNIDYWNSSMIRSKANYLVTLGIDLVILARFENTLDEGILASACAVMTIGEKN